MRQLGESMEKSLAERLQAFLASRAIASDLRADDGQRVGIWILDEDRLAEAGSHYQAFRLRPDDAAFNAPTLPKKPEPPPSRIVDVRSEVFGASRIGTVTLAFIVLSIGLTLAYITPSTRDLTYFFRFSEFGGRDFPEILSGQVWRLVTPIFLHGGLLHLFFNMLWLFQLGGAVEENEGPRRLLLYVLIGAALVNTAQYLVSGANFLGMSGIVYMLLGYIWMMAKYKAGTRYALASQTVSFMLIWLVVCLVGLIPGVANTEHVGGLILGVSWGFWKSGHWHTIQRRRRYRGH